MVTIRRNTFETNSSSTHSYSIDRDTDDWEKLRKLFDEILYDMLPDACDKEDLCNILIKLNEAQNLIIEGTDYYD